MEQTSEIKNGITSVTITANSNNHVTKVYTSSDFIFNLLKYNGINYDLSEWITISKYAEFKKVKVNTVCNWIKRGKIDKDNIVVIEEFNNLTLIRK